MPGNVATLERLRGLQQYLPEGVAALAYALTRGLPVDVKLADNLLMYSATTLTTTPVEIDATPGAKPVCIIVQSTGTAAWLHLHNSQVGGTVAGTNPDFVVPVAGTAGELTGLLVLGDSWDRFWSLGLTAVVSNAVETAAAPANLPVVYIVYAGS